MEQQKPDNWFDSYVRENMQDFTPAPPSGGWAQMQPNAARSVPGSGTSVSIFKSVWTWIAGSALMAGITAAVYIQYPAENKVKPNPQESKPSIQIQMAPPAQNQDSPDSEQDAITSASGFSNSLPDKKTTTKGEITDRIRVEKPKQSDIEKAPSILPQVNGSNTPDFPPSNLNPIPAQNPVSQPFQTQQPEHQKGAIKAAIEADLHLFPQVSFFIAGIENSDILWEFGDGQKSNGGARILHQYSNADTQTVWVKAWISGDESPIERMFSLPSATEPLIPDIFTPNGDRMNDAYEIDFRGKPVEQIEWTIVNLKGEVVFRSDNIQKGWDGTFLGQPAPSGKYILQIQWIEPLKSKAQRINKPIYLNR